MDNNQWKQEKTEISYMKITSYRINQIITCDIIFEKNKTSRNKN